MSIEQEEALLANVKSITDRLDMVDRVFKAARMGEEMILVFQCNESGLFFPADYVRKWGTDYGLFLGPDVCSETLQSQYDVAPPLPDRYITSIDQLMHPLRVSRSQVDALLVDAQFASENMAILDVADPLMLERAPILLQKQRANPLSKLHVVAGLSPTEAMYKIGKKGWV